MGQRNRVKNKNDNQSQQSIYKPEEIFKIKKETDQYLKFTMSINVARQQ